MARPVKTGLDYFPLDVTIDDKMELIEAEHGLQGFAIVIKLWQKIYGSGYFIEWSEDHALLFTRKINSELTLVNSVVNSCFRRNLLSYEVYNDYGVLTSAGIQKRFLLACKQSKRLNIYVEEHILLVNPEEIGINSGITVINSEFSTQRKVKESKVKESILSCQNFDFSDEKIQTTISPDSENPDEKPENPKQPKTPSEKIDYLKLAEYWNTTTKFAKVTTMSDTRKKSINARFKEHGKHVIQQVIDKAAESKFLNGDNDKNWTANFDWIFKPTNFVKILEGNYDNRNKKKPSITDIWPELAGKEGIE